MTEDEGSNYIVGTRPCGDFMRYVLRTCAENIEFV